MDALSTEPELEPTMIGDGAPLSAIHTEPEQGVPEVDAHKDITAPPAGPEAKVTSVDPQIEPEATGPHPLTVAPIPPCTEQELR